MYLFVHLGNQFIAESLWKNLYECMGFYFLGYNFFLFYKKNFKLKCYNCKPNKSGFCSAENN